MLYKIILNLAAISWLFAEQPAVRAVVLLPDRSRLLSQRELHCVKDLHVVGMQIPGVSRRLQYAVQTQYVGQTINDELLQSLKKTLYEYFRGCDRPFVTIGVPEQDCSSGVVQLVVQESKVGKVSVVGNRWLPAKRVARYFALQPGQPICCDVISKDLNFVNRNPFRRVSVAYAPGAERNTTDVVLEVQDRRPYRFYMGFDNTGVVTTGRQRAFAGFSWDQVFGLDHTFFYQYTTNYDIKRFHANTFQYMAMLPRETILNLYGGYSVVHADLPNPSRHNKGSSAQASLRYHMPAIPIHGFTQELIVGFDWKNTNNTMEFVDYAPVFGHTVNLTQFVLGYQWGWDGGVNSIRSGAEGLFSPGRLLPNQTDADFQSLRPGAKSTWIYGVFFFNYRRALFRSTSYSFFLRGQWSSAALLPSEQLGIGGYDTVRGYDQRQMNADNGFYLSHEFHSAPFSLLSKKKNPDRMYFLAFLDLGYGTDKVAVPEVKPRNWLMGAGPGVRYCWTPYIDGRLDVGFKLHNQKVFTGGSPMVQFSIVGSY